jgi:hypothetical protein
LTKECWHSYRSRKLLCSCSNGNISGRRDTTRDVTLAHALMRPSTLDCIRGAQQRRQVHDLYDLAQGRVRHGRIAASRVMVSLRCGGGGLMKRFSRLPHSTGAKHSDVMDACNAACGDAYHVAHWTFMSTSSTSLLTNCTRHDPSE